MSLRLDGARADNRKLCGARQIWHVLRRDGQDVARCTVERLMRALGIRGVVRGKRVVTTNPFAIALEPVALRRLTISALPGRQGEPALQGGSAKPAVGRAIVRHWFKNNGERLHFCADRVGRSPLGSNQWRLNGSLCAAPRHRARTNGAFNGAFNGSMIDVFARRIVGWRVSPSMTTKFVPDALDQAIWQRKTPDNQSLVPHSDRGSQYLPIKHTERLAEAGIALSVGTVGDAYDRASGRHWFKSTGEGPGRMRHPFGRLRGPTGATVALKSSKPRSSTRSAPGHRCARSGGKP